MQDTFSGKISDSLRSEIEFNVEPDIVANIPKFVCLWNFYDLK